MRLIDADELKKSFEDTVCIEPMPYAFVKQIIDNAPTVDAKTTGDCIIAYGDGYETARRLYERPQGEWIPNYTSQFMNPGRSCSLCGKIVEFSENYCPNCGAYMRGEEE